MLAAALLSAICVPPADAGAGERGGHSADPRSAVEIVYIDGGKVYDTATDRRRF